MTMQINQCKASTGFSELILQSGVPLLRLVNLFLSTTIKFHEFKVAAGGPKPAFKGSIKSFQTVLMVITLTWGWEGRELNTSRTRIMWHTQWQSTFHG